MTGGLLVKKEYDAPVYEIEKFLTVTVICSTSDDFNTGDNVVEVPGDGGFDF